MRRLIKRGRLRKPAELLYARAVEQARQPEFYASHGVPDTLDGRFDMVALHVFLLLHRLKGAEAPAGDLAQALFDVMFDDMDQNLREIGVGDLSVGKRVKAMARALYGRCAAYETGLVEGDEALAEALRRNLYGTASPSPSEVAALVFYVKREARSMAGVPLPSLLAGKVEFGPSP